MSAKGHIACALVSVEPHLGLKPLPILLDKGDQRDRNLANMGCEMYQIIITGLRTGIQNTVQPKSLEAFDFVRRYRICHRSIVMTVPYFANFGACAEMLKLSEA